MAQEIDVDVDISGVLEPVNDSLVCIGKAIALLTGRVRKLEAWVKAQDGDFEPGIDPALVREMEALKEKLRPDDRDEAQDAEFEGDSAAD